MLASDSFDVALLMGRMYHIVEQKEGAMVLIEFKRFLKQRGVAILHI